MCQQESIPVGCVLLAYMATTRCHHHGVGIPGPGIGWVYISTTLRHTTPPPGHGTSVYGDPPDMEPHCVGHFC